MPETDETAAVLGPQTYRDAWDAVMTGTEPGMLPDDQRDALRKARELTHTPSPGLPLPLGTDPTRPVFQAPPEGSDAGGDDVA